MEEFYFSRQELITAFAVECVYNELRRLPKHPPGDWFCNR